jgi:hypothetical protein
MFAKKNFIGESADIFYASVTDKDLWQKFPDNSIDNVFFANMFANILGRSTVLTRNMRMEIIRQAFRIAKKNIILNEKVYMQSSIFLAQKYRALFYEDFSEYFKKFKEKGNLLLAQDFFIFHKQYDA